MSNYRYSNKSFRETYGISNDTVIKIFRDLHKTVSEIHRANVVIGDFNDTNVLVRGRAAYLIDAHSFQFGQYPCVTFKDDFMDPKLYDKRANPLARKSGAEASRETDWYAYNVMLLQTLLFVKPYGGISKISERERVRNRITIFDIADEEFPKNALHYSMLPKEIHQYFRAVFKFNERGPFPLEFLDMLSVPLSMDMKVVLRIQ